MKEHSEFIIGETYRYMKSQVDYTCVAFDLRGNAILQRKDGRDSVFSVASPLNYVLAPTPPVVTKKFRNLYAETLGQPFFSLEEVRAGAKSIDRPLAQLEYTYTDGVITDVAFIKQIGT